MSSSQKAQAAFIAGVLLLFLSGLAAYFTIARLLESQQLVIHTEGVRASLGDIDSALVRAGRARSGFMISQSQDFLVQFEAADLDIPAKLQRFRDLTTDNPKQQELSTRLEQVVSHRQILLRKQIQAKQENPQDRATIEDLDRQGLPIASDITAIMQQMRDEEQSLLEIRERAPRRLFILAAVTLFSAFILALVLFATQYHFLFVEVRARAQAEQIARDREESLRQLTSRLLQLQDAERRKFSRELHDSLGQYLVGVKMNLEMFATRPNPELLAEAVQLLDQSIVETRTISHLLHPPLLDEAGLSSAAKWYLEGFSQRSGIELKVNIPDDIERLPRPVELGLFRGLQESLTNIHRHSESKRADVSIVVSADHALLEVRDYGKGIQPGLIRSLEHKGAHPGVGLAGMRERIGELGGQLQIQPRIPGTLISISIPLPKSGEPRLHAAD